MAWLWLLLASLLEIGWPVALKYAKGLTRPGPSLLAGAVSVISFLFLAQALKSLPVGTAYAIWVGIGAAGVAVVGMLLLGESRDLPRLFFLVLIVAGVVGLRVVER